MRIALLTHQYPGARLGGIGAYTLQAARAMAAAGHEVHLFTPTLPPGIPIPAELTVHQVADLAARVQAGTLPPPLPAALQHAGEAAYRMGLACTLCQALRQVHHRMPFDVVEAAEYEALGLPLMLDPLEGAVPVVTHLHSGSAIRRVGNALCADEATMLFEAFEYAAILGADALCAATRQIVADTRKLVPFDASVTTIPLPFAFDESTAFIPPPAQGDILFVGRLERLKGVETLASALALFLPPNPGARVVLAGPDTPTADGNTSMAAEMRRILGDQAPRVAFLGEQNRAQLDALLARSAFVVLPSLYDNFPYVACEAMAAGRAVVVSNAIGAAELVGPAGIAFERANPSALATAIEALHRAPDRAASLARAAYDRARALLSTRVTVPQRVAFYQRAREALRRHGRPDVQRAFTQIPPQALAALLPAMVRLTGVLADAPSPSAQTPGTRLLAALERFSPGKPVRIFLYGAGRHTTRLLAERHLWERAGHRVVGLVDDHPRFTATPEHLGLPVRSLATFAEAVPQETASETPLALVLSTDTFEEQFWQQTHALRAAGIPVLRLYDPS